MAEGPSPEVLRSERIRELYGQRGGAIYVAPAMQIFAATQAVAIIWPVVDHVRAGVWIGVMLVAVGVTTALVRAFHRRPRTDDELPRWGRRRAAAEVAHGLAWSAMAPLVYAPDHPITLAATLALVAGMVGGITASLSVHRPSMASFLASGILPAVGWLLITRTSMNEVYASLMLAATALLAAANAARMSRFYDEGIRLRLSLAAQLENRRQLQEAAEEGRRMAEESRLVAEEAQLVAEEAAAERVRFFGAASHDLRQPVHALGLYASLLRQDPPARERRELIANIGSCVDSLDRLFKGILGMAGAAKAAQEAAIVPLPLQDVFDRVALQLRPEAERKGLELRVRPTALWVHADPGVVERILVNLAANGIRYTERGRVLLAARVRRRRIDLVVADTGVGLDETERHRIFEPFYQVGLPHRDRAQGFGLGLATVRQLCESHGFPLDVRARPGVGAMFRVSLPQAAAEDRQSASRPPLDMPPRLNVLVVEDDPLVADAVTRLLKGWGVAVRICATPAEALEVLEARKPGPRWHALLDYRLPGETNGLELADRIRARHGRDVSVSLITGEADPLVFAEARARRIPVMQKPLKPIRVRALLAKDADLLSEDAPI